MNFGKLWSALTVSMLAVSQTLHSKFLGVGIMWFLVQLLLAIVALCLGCNPLQPLWLWISGSAQTPILAFGIRYKSWSLGFGLS